MELAEKGVNMTIFWIVHAITLGLFGVELLFLLTVWLKARVPGVPARAAWWRKIFPAIGYVLGVVFSHRLWPLLRAFVVDGLLQRRLWQKSRRRWTTHILVFGSFLILGILSTITGVVVEFLPLLGMSHEAAASIPVVGPLFHADVWWVALVNEILGLALLVGMVLVLYRRFVKKDPQLRVNPIDNRIVFLLTAIAISGILTEAFRLLANYTLPSGVFAPAPEMLSPEKLPTVLYPMWGPQWGFVGYGLAWLLGQLQLSPEVWLAALYVMFWLHFVIVSALLFYFPFSRFAHVLLGPIVVSYNSMLDHEKRHPSPGAGHSVPQVPAAAGRGTE